MDSYQIGLLVFIVLVAYLLFRKRKKKVKEQQKPEMKIFRPHEYKKGEAYRGKRSHNGNEKCYPNYPAPAPFCDDPSFSLNYGQYREANHEFRMLRLEYDTIIKRHNRVSAKIKRVTKTAPRAQSL